MCAPGFFLFFCKRVGVCVRVNGLAERIIQQAAHKWGGHEEIIASAHTQQSLSQHLFLFTYSSVSLLSLDGATLCTCSSRYHDLYPILKMSRILA